MTTLIEGQQAAYREALYRYKKSLLTIQAAAHDELLRVTAAVNDGMTFDPRHEIVDAAEEIAKTRDRLDVITQYAYRGGA